MKAFFYFCFFLLLSCIHCRTRVTPSLVKLFQSFSLFLFFNNFSTKMGVEKSSGTVPLRKLTFDYRGNIKSYFKTNGVIIEAVGWIGVEHRPVNGGFDGFCMTALCEAVEIVNDNTFEWVELDTNLSFRVKEILGKSSFIKYTM